MTELPGPGVDRSGSLGRWGINGVRRRCGDLAIAAAVLLSSALIAVAARGDLWFDEIWSIYLAREAGSAKNILRLLHDNNHPLNTIYLLYLGDQERLWSYRVLAVVSGIASLLLAGYIARREWGKPEALCSVVLIGTSYPLLVYFSEARGYAPAMAFALASSALIGANMRRFSPVRLVLFWVCSVLGILCHATFIIAILGLTAWTVAQKTRATIEVWPARARFIALHHALPLASYSAWYFFFLRRMTIGGGDPHGAWAEVCRGAALLLGLPDVPPAREAAVAATVLVVLIGAAVLRRDGSAQWSLYPGLLLAALLLILVARDNQLLQFRYFVIVFPFVYLLLSRIICRLGRDPRSGLRWTGTGLMLLLVAGQIPRDYQLIDLGRGDYSSALRAISQSAPTDLVHVGSDHDFRNRLLFQFYAHRAIIGTQLRYVTQVQWRDMAPDWYVAHSQDASYQPPAQLLLPEAGRYRLAQAYGFSGVSGWRWFLYRRISGSGTGPAPESGARRPGTEVRLSMIKR